jgi:uncharacterized cupredoxin-like copper-binding protein
MRMRMIALVAVAGLALVGAGCSSGGSGSNGGGKTAVDVGVKEFTITPNVTHVEAGPVTFHVANDGTTEHEMVLIRTDSAPGGLPIKDGEASEKGAMGEVDGLEAGQSGSVTLNLKPGHYLMICNVPGHYLGGMRTAFTVS